MSTNTINPNLLKSRQHFEVLDGLRGVAAIGVVIYHFMEEVITDYSKNFIGHGHLAVDFFFCLSGFVIAYAYENRIEKVGFWNFLKLRLIRLHPMIILGAILGLLAFLFDPFATYQNLYSFKETVIIFFASIFLIPIKVMPERFLNLFPLNAPSWSLFWEYIANIAYALFLFKLGKKILIILTVLAAIALCYIGYTHKTLSGGWGWYNGANELIFWDGGIRLLFSFLMGMLIYRANWIIKNKIGFIGLGILLFATLVTPYSEQWNWLIEPLTVLLVYPLLVALGAGTTVKNGLKKLCNFSGNISYPLYTTHFAVIWIFANYYNTQKPSFEFISWIMVGGTISCIAFAYLVLKFYDIPFRKFLSDKMKKSLAK